jgi:hypothetical protein
LPTRRIGDSASTSATIPDCPSRAPRSSTPGTYVFRWNSSSVSAVVDDSITIQVGAAVPESSTWVMMCLGFAGLGFAGYRARKRKIGTRLLMKIPA